MHNSNLSGGAVEWHPSLLQKSNGSPRKETLVQGIQPTQVPYQKSDGQLAHSMPVVETQVQTKHRKKKEAQVKKPRHNQHATNPYNLASQENFASKKTSFTKTIEKLTCDEESRPPVKILVRPSKETENLQVDRKISKESAYGTKTLLLHSNKRPGVSQPQCNQPNTPQVSHAEKAASSFQPVAPLLSWKNDEEWPMLPVRALSAPSPALVSFAPNPKETVPEEIIPIISKKTDHGSGTAFRKEIEDFFKPLKPREVDENILGGKIRSDLRATGKISFKPRKKKLTTLKKRILKERLHIWNTSLAGNTSQATEDFCAVQTLFLKLPGAFFATPENPKEIYRVKNSVKEIVQKYGVGEVQNIFVPMHKSEGNVLITYQSDYHVKNAATCLQGVIFDKQALQPKVEIFDSSEALSGFWKVVINGFSSMDSAQKAPAAENFYFALTSSLIEATQLLENSLFQFEKLLPNILIANVYLEDEENAHACLQILNGASILHFSLSATCEKIHSQSPLCSGFAVSIQGLISEEELEDEEEHEEIISDLKVLGEKFGPVIKAEIFKGESSGASPSSVIYYRDLVSQEKALEGFQGKVIRGNTLKVCRFAGSSNSNLMHKGISIKGLVLKDSLNDDEEYAEVLSDVRNLAAQSGSVVQVEIPREGERAGEVFVLYQDHSSYEEALRAFQLKVVSGKNLEVKGCMWPFVAQPFTKELVVKGFLELDDFEDEEELNEIVENIHQISSECGSVENISIPREGPLIGQVSLIYKDLASHERALQVLSEKLVRGKLLQVLEREITDRHTPKEDEHDCSTQILVKGLISVSDLQDDEEYEEVLSNINEIAKSFGKVSEISVPRDSPHFGYVFLTYETILEAKAAAKGLSSQVFGGVQIVAEVLSQVEAHQFCVTTNTPVSKQTSVSKSKNEVQSLQSIYKNAAQTPRLPKPSPLRQLLVPPNDSELDELVFQLLKMLMDFQRRAAEHDPENAKRKRRLVCGLREVKKGIKLGKITLVILAPDTEQGALDGSLDDQVSEILKMAEEKKNDRHNIESIFALTRRKIGKALGKTIRVCCVGIYNADGAFDVVKKIRERLKTLQLHNVQSNSSASILSHAQNDANYAA